MQRRMIGAVTVLVLGSAAQAFAGQLALGKANAKPGRSATVPITFRQGGPVAVAVGTDITFDTKALSKPRCETGSAVSTSGPGAKMVICSEPKPGVVRLAVLGLNTAPLPNGEIALLTFDVASSTQHQLYVLHQTPGGADANGTDFRLRNRNGSIHIK